MKPLPVRVAYTVTELADATGIDRRQLGRILESAGVTFVRARRTRFVSASELERKLTPLWDGIVTAHSVARTGGEAPPASTSIDLDEHG